MAIPVENPEFDLDVEDLSDLEIRPTSDDDKFFYFFHTERGVLIKSFVLGRTKRTKQTCGVTLIRNDLGKFEPRLEFSIRDTGTNAIASVKMPVAEGEMRAVKARVDLKPSHENFWKLIRYLEAAEEIQLPTQSFQIVPRTTYEIVSVLTETPRETTLAALSAALPNLTEKEVALLANRRASLNLFEELLIDDSEFEAARSRLGPAARPEDVWQEFFERNEWIFGYGLRLISCESLDQRKLETIVTGSSLITGAGKRIDALMRTRGHISSLLFCEIKTPSARLTMASEYRPEVFAPGEHLRGGVAQVQKTIHKVSLSLSQNHKELTRPGGSPTGEVVAVVRPRGVVVVGQLSEFEEENGTNYERFASFELYRSSLTGLDILTFDELLARARYIVDFYAQDSTG